MHLCRNAKLSNGLKVQIPDVSSDWYDKIRWMLYKAPQIEIVRKNVVYSDAKSEDIEYTGIINEAAKEDTNWIRYAAR